MKINRILPLAALLLSGTVATFAHHSFDAEFDRTKPITLKGTVSKVEFMNPHMWTREQRWGRVQRSGISVM